MVYSVANPVFARAKSDPRMLAAAYSQSVTQAALISGPILAILAATFAPSLESIVGPKWLPAAVIGSLITIAEAIRVPIWFDKSLMYALARPGVELGLTVIDTAVLVVVVIVGTFWGIDWVAAGLVVRAMLAWPLRLVVSCRLTGQRPGPFASRLLRIWLAAAIGAAWPGPSSGQPWGCRPRFWC